MTFEDLRSLLDRARVKYCIDSDNRYVLARFARLNGFVHLSFSLQSNGEFLQIRAAPSFGMLHIPEDRRYAALEVLMNLNAVHRLVKVGVDRLDGRVTIDADAWTCDGSLTVRQLDRMIGAILNFVDHATQLIIDAAAGRPDTTLAAPLSFREFRSLFDATEGACGEDKDDDKTDEDRSKAA